MRKSLLVLMLAVLVTFGPAAYAGSRVLDTHTGNYSGGIPNSNVVVKASAGLVYNITLVATANSATVSVFDQASGTGSASTLAYEVQVATANNTATVNMNGAPMNMDKGILVSATNGTAFINYQ